MGIYEFADVRILIILFQRQKLCCCDNIANKKFENDILTTNKRKLVEKNNHVKTHQKYRESIIKYICDNKNLSKNTKNTDSFSIEANFNESDCVNKLII